MSAVRGGTGPAATSTSTPASRPETVPSELVPAWDLLERGAVGSVVVDVEGGAFWPTINEPARHRELGRRLEAGGNLHPSLSPAAFAILRATASVRAGSGASLSSIWAFVPEWCHPGVPRPDVIALELELIVEKAAPDPDVALFLAAVAASRIPISAIAAGPLSDDQVRRRLEHPALDAVTWRSVVPGTAHGNDAAAQAMAAGGSHGTPVLLLTSRAADADDLLVVRLGAGARDETALERIVARITSSDEASAVPGAVRDAWAEGARDLGPVLVGFAEWAARHASGHPGAPVVALSEPGSLLPELLAETALGLGLPLAVRTLPLTPELVAALEADGSAVGTALTLATAGDTHTPAEVAGLLGLSPEHDDVPSLGAALAADPGLRARAAEHARALEGPLLEGTAPPADAPSVPLVVCHVGGSGDLQGLLTRSLESAGLPRHVVGLHLASESGAADAILGGGEVLGYLANLGIPADANAIAASWRARLEELAGVPGRDRTSLTPAASVVKDDLRSLRIEAARRGVLAFQRQHLRLLTVAGNSATLVDAGPGLADRLATAPATPSVAASPRPADALPAPAWIARVVAPLERDLASARAELATRDAVVSSRAYRFVLRLRGIVRRVRG